jgi:hypothetical protein
MAKVIKIAEYRGVKIRSGDKAVLHLTDSKLEKIHLHLTWTQVKAILRDFGKAK